jgi:hypothetical protein
MLLEKNIWGISNFLEIHLKLSEQAKRGELEVLAFDWNAFLDHISLFNLKLPLLLW